MNPQPGLESYPNEKNEQDPHNRFAEPWYDADFPMLWILESGGSTKDASLGSNRQFGGLPVDPVLFDQGCDDT